MELKYNKKLWEKKFYPINGLNYKKLRLSKIGYYSITKKSFIDKILHIIETKFKNDDVIITDATSGVGMISIILAQKYKINAVEILEEHIEIIKNNSKVYGIENNITLINDDYTKVMYNVKQDIIIMDPPWEQEDNKYYKSKNKLDLFLNKINVIDIINSLFEKEKVLLLILFIPHNYDITKFVHLINLHKINIYKVENEKHYIISVEKN
jgi:tRNA1(Val) A37 N6-methylase TrmN6